MSPTIDLAPQNPDAPKEPPSPTLPPNLLAAVALAAAERAFGQVTPAVASAPPKEQDGHEALCVTCGHSVPATEIECAFCIHARAAQSNSKAQLLRHWLVFIIAMLAVFAAGWILMP